MSGDSPLDRIALIGADGNMAAMVAQALSDVPGVSVLILGDEPRFNIIDEAADMARLAMLDGLLAVEGPDQRYRDRLGFMHARRSTPTGEVDALRWLLPRREVTHIDTPKPISKRKARRLRGKASA